MVDRRIGSGPFPVKPSLVPVGSVFGRFARWVMLLLFVLFLLPAWALDCPNCGRKNLSSLVMVCPQCQAMVHTAEIRARQKCSGTLAIEVYYTGKRSDKLPVKGTILLNRKKAGELPLLDRSEREGLILSGVDRQGLGVDYTAVYRGELRELREGIYDLEIELSLPWLSGFLRQNTKVAFPRLGVKEGRTTLVRHIFRSPGTFSQRAKPEEERSHPSVVILPVPHAAGAVPGPGPTRIPPLEPDAFKPWRQDPEILPQPELRMGSGTIGIDLPVF